MGQQRTTPVKLRDVRPGDKLIADHGFTCIRTGALVDVAADDKGALYVPCKRGRHYLDGQVDGPEGNLLGLSPPAPRRIPFGALKAVLIRWWPGAIGARPDPQHADGRSGPARLA
jgi:hypothetical protein